MLVASMNSLAVELTNHVKPLNKNVTENKISLNFQNIKLRSALQLLAEFSGYNFIIDDKIQSILFCKPKA